MYSYGFVESFDGLKEYYVYGRGTKIVFLAKTHMYMAAVVQYSNGTVRCSYEPVHAQHKHYGDIRRLPQLAKHLQGDAKEVYLNWVQQYMKERRDNNV